jgi:hypothetical protein
MFAVKFEGRNHSEVVCVSRRIILKLILREYDRRAKTGFI